MPASPRGCYSRCSSEQHKSSDSGLSSPRPGHGVVFLPLCDGTHSCSFPSSEERTMHVAVTTWPPIKRVLRLSAAPSLAWCDRHGPPRWSSPGRRGTLGLPPSSFSVLSLSFPRRSENRHPATALPVSARRCGSARFQLLCEQRSTRCCRRCRPATRSASAASSRALGAVSLQRLSQRSLQAAVAWLRSAGGTTHSKPTLLESASQPASAIRIQIILARVPSGTHRTLWEGGLFTPERFARPVPQPALQPRRHRSLRLPARSSTLALMRAALMSQQRAHPPIICSRSLPQSATLGVLISSLFNIVNNQYQPVTIESAGPSRPVVGIYRVSLRVLYLLPASGATCAHSEVAGPVAGAKIGALARPSSLPHATINPSVSLFIIPSGWSQSLKMRLRR